jgi:RNA polymerase sigma factor (sigma-70 family)
MIVSAIAAQAFETDRRLLWGLCYRMTGNAADADDIVQETFVKTIENPPRNTEEPLRPWLIRVAMNISRDYLRRRRRRGYTGPWLPSPVPTDDAESPASYEPPALSEDSPAARYEMLESISFAFLLALEALTPSQRAALLLRDVFDYSTEETAIALDMTEANVKVLLHRARKRMKEYDKTKAAFTPARQQATQRALEQFLLYMNTRNAEGLERLLAEDITSLSDGGGEVAAALQPIRGRGKMLRLIAALSGKTVSQPRISFRILNGQPALLFEEVNSLATRANRYTVHIEVDEARRIHKLDAVLAPSKLSAIK